MCLTGRKDARQAGTSTTTGGKLGAMPPTTVAASASSPLVRLAAFVAAAFAVAALLGLALIAPILYNLYVLPTHYARSSAHPGTNNEGPSSSTSTPYYVPPRSHQLSPAEIAAFRRDGLLVLRNVLPPSLIDKLLVAGDDLMAVPNRHCEMTKFTSPPIFHGYERYCGRASLVHDYLRDVTYTSPLTHVAAQLLLKDDEDDESLRNLADVFMAGVNLPRRWHSDYLAFEKLKAPPSPQEIGCGDGLVVWMPLEPSYETKAGMVFLNGTSRLMEQRFSEDPSQARNLFLYRSWLRSLDKSDYFAPTLNVGDAIVFDECTVHATSGINTEGLLRRAYQLRFVRGSKVDPQLLEGIEEDVGIVAGPPLHPRVPGVTMPQVWPRTLPAEDAVRAAGPVVYSRGAWIERMTLSPAFTLFTSTMALKTRWFGDPGELDGEPDKSFDDLVRNFLFWRQGKRVTL